MITNHPTWPRKQTKQTNMQTILTSGKVIDLLLGGLSITLLRLAATEKKKIIIIIIAHSLL